MLSTSLIIILLTSAFYNVALQISIILVPLYALSLKISALNLGLLISIPAFLQLLIRPLGGVISDLRGEKIILMASYFSITLAGLVFFKSYTFLGLLLAQLMVSFSRAIFWSTAQTYLTKLPTAKVQLNRTVGLFTSFSNIGAIIGLVLGGVFAQWLGYSIAFLWLTVFGLISCALCFVLPSLPHSNTEKINISSLFSLGRVLKIKPLYLAGVCAYIAALPISLIGSFYPVYLDAVGITESMIGVITSFRSIGTIVAGLAIAKYLDRFSQKLSYTISLVIVGGSLIIFQMFSDVILLIIIIFFTGIGAGISHILYQVITSKYSPEDSRGAAMSLSSNFWSLSHLITPFIFGIIIELLGLSASFIIVGVVIVMLGAIGKFLFHWLIDSGQKLLEIKETF